MLGFGFVLFLMLVVLSVIYSQYVVRHPGNVVDTNSLPMPTGDQPWRDRVVPPANEQASRSVVVTPETAAVDLIDEALADRDDLSAFTEDELADLEEGN
jgi:hypothetical protein